MIGLAHTTRRRFCQTSERRLALRCAYPTPPPRKTYTNTAVYDSHRTEHRLPPNACLQQVLSYHTPRNPSYTKPNKTSAPAVKRQKQAVSKIFLNLPPTSSNSHPVVPSWPPRQRPCLGQKGKGEGKRWVGIEPPPPTQSATGPRFLTLPTPYQSSNQPRQKNGTNDSPPHPLRHRGQPTKTPFLELAHITSCPIHRSVDPSIDLALSFLGSTSRQPRLPQKVGNDLLRQIKKTIETPPPQKKAERLRVH